MRPNPYQPPGWSVASNLHQRSARFMRAAEAILALGLLCTALAAALMQFVIIGLFGLGLFVVAFGLLLAAGLLARADGHPPWWQQVASLALYVIAVLSLIAIAAYATSLAFAYAMAPRGGTSGSSGWQWTVLMLISIMAAAAVAIALRYRTGWSRSHCFTWGIAAFGVSPTAILLFWILKLTGQPLTA